MNTLECLREKIDELDKNIVSLLEERFLVSKDIAKAKKELSKSVLCIKREDEVIKKNISYLKSSEFENNLIMIYNCIMRESKDIQNRENLIWSLD